MLVQICGLPGAGKTTLSAAIADARPAVWLRIDAIEAAMWSWGIAPEQTGIAAYAVAHAVARPHLRRGQLVLADAVSPSAESRAGWGGTAAAEGQPLLVVEVVCPDPVEHRRRVEQRTSDLAGLVVPTWADVEATAAGYEARTDDDRLVLDSTADPAANLALVLARIDGA